MQQKPKRYLPAIALSLIALLSAVGCATTQEGLSDSESAVQQGIVTAGGAADTESSPISAEKLRAASGESEELAVRFVEAVRDRDYESMVEMTALYMLAPQAPWSADTLDIARAIDWRCAMYRDTTDTDRILGDQWVHGVLTGDIWGNSDYTRARSECAGIAGNNPINDTICVTVAVAGSGSRYEDEAGHMYITVGLKQDSEGIWRVAPIDIYREYAPGSFLGEGDEAHLYVYNKATVSINGAVLEPDEDYDDPYNERFNRYTLDPFCTGAPIVVDIDYGYMQLQDFVIVSVSANAAALSGNGAIVHTNLGPAMYRTQFDVSLLALTHPEGAFDYIYAELENHAHKFTDMIHECLVNKDLEGFAKFAYTPVLKNTRDNFTNGLWDANDLREITVTSMRQTGMYTWWVEFDCTITLASGNCYIASSFYELGYDPNEGTWIIIKMDDNRITGKSSQYWTAIP